MVKIDLTKDFGKIPKILEQRAAKWIRKALLVLIAELKRLTPEDTKEMLASYRVIWVKKEGQNLIWSIGNDAEHAVYVEFGVKGRSFNYHKPKWTTFFKGGSYKGLSGNRTFARALDNKRQEILNIIAKEIWL